MRCAHCKENGPEITVDHVRNCDGQVTWAEKRAKEADNDGPMWPPSDAQVNYLLGLQEERQLPAGYTPRIEMAIRLMERDAVSGDITFLKALPRKQGKQGEHASRYTMPEGRYALEMDGTWLFFQVDKPTEGRWAGYTFLKRLIGAPGQYQKLPAPPAMRTKVLGAIERDPKTAMLDYGLHSGVCGRCASPLTDPQSLRLGIGPKCRAKSGWFE